ncbi:MAG: nucleotidyltransferase domain-containing protein [bacterium]
MDREKILKKLTKLARELKEKDGNVLRVILFGSLVEDTYTPYSDADILIILKKSELPIIERIPYFLLHFSRGDLPVDVFPYTEEEVKSIPFAQRALLKGIPLA